MKCRSDSLDGGEDPRTPTAADAVGGESSEPSKKQRTEEPSASNGAGECSSSSSSPRAPPQQTPPPPAGEEQARVPDLGEDLVFEVLMRAEARTLASAACVSRAWRQLARDERLWEAACVREWASLGSSEQMLRRVVLSLGGFRRLHERYIRPLQLQRHGTGVRRWQAPVRIARDQVQVSLSLLSTSFFQNMPNAPPAAPKKKDKDNDKNGGGKCG